MPPLSPAATIRNALRKLEQRDPNQHAPGRNYRVSAELEANTPETVTLRIKLSSITGPSFSIGTPIPCPRDELKSHIAGLVDEATAQGFILAESKDALRAKAVDFLEANPLQNPTSTIRTPVATHARRASQQPPKKEVATPTEKVAAQTFSTPLTSSTYEPPETMKELYAALQEVKKPYILKLVSCRPHDNSKKCTVSVGFKLANGDEVVKTTTIPNATMESSIDGYVVKPALREDIISTIAAVMKVPKSVLEDMVSGQNRPRYTVSSTDSYTTR